MTRAEPWTPLDSAAVAKLLAFGLSFDLRTSIAPSRSAAIAGRRGAAGFDGTALFFEDLFRSAPFDAGVDRARPPRRWRRRRPTAPVAPETSQRRPRRGHRRRAGAGDT